MTPALLRSRGTLQPDKTLWSLSASLIALSEMITAIASGVTPEPCLTHSIPLFPGVLGLRRSELGLLRGAQAPEESE